MPDQAARAAAGARHLDTHTPGWAARVDPTRIDNRLHRWSVLGQVYADPRELPMWQALGHRTLDEAKRAVWSGQHGDLETPTRVDREELARILLGLDDDGLCTFGFTEPDVDEAGFPDWRGLDEAWAREARERTVRRA